MLVSVVMAVYNGAGYIEKSIESILSQTYSNLEVIIVDDGSTDDTRRILEQVNDIRVKAVLLTENRGSAAALNIGIAKAKGKWVAIHDADDISFPDRIKEQVGYLKENPHLVAAGSFIECFSDEQGGISEYELIQYQDTRNSVKTSEDIRLGLYYGCPITHGTLIYSKAAFEAVGGYDTNLRIAYDYDLCTRLVTVGPIENVPKKLYKYRRYQDSLSNKNLLVTSNELFFSFCKYIRNTCFKDMKQAPILAVCGSEEGAYYFAQQAKNILNITVFSNINEDTLREISYYFKTNKLDGVIILDNLKNKDIALSMLIKSGMILNKNLFQFWCRL
ncbi:glycosyltransferase family 2 protein [Dethiobacter alkaliphilus]|uniref:Glycosyl transferase family 2 n=1 Tax=Dethiobacter alkaliphilus AHT 1 TaxID=555088 RepID=C0GHI4_DETAL|nr:glycosyltransferase [Dethiobacter alkaliphilus]EEG77190.1 glycosyl transferase family 2 [Dethiobacter alkaliphilus AHT 1]